MLLLPHASGPFYEGEPRSLSSTHQPATDQERHVSHTSRAEATSPGEPKAMSELIQAHEVPERRESLHLWPHGLLAVSPETAAQMYHLCHLELAQESTYPDRTCLPC